MRLFYRGKDGGPESPVTGYFLIEVKWLFSIVVLKFNKGMRENYHSHAFNALTWFLKGKMREYHFDCTTKLYKKSIIPKLTLKSCLHKVFAYETSWCISIRGPWAKTWQEYSPRDKKFITLSSPGRKEIL